jgi:beta-ureidopropionase
MPRTVKCGLIQATNAAPTDAPIAEIKRANVEKVLQMIGDAARQGVQILCMQEVFNTPYFCAEQETRWYEAVERIPDGPTVKLMQDVAKQHGMVIIVPIYEEEITGLYYNTAAVIDADGKYLGKYRKNHIPHVAPTGLASKMTRADPRRLPLAIFLMNAGTSMCVGHARVHGASKQ